MWKIRFRDDLHDDPIELYAEDVVIEEASYFICILGIRTKYRSQHIIVPGGSNFEEFAQFDPLYIPQGNVIYCGQFKEGEVKQMPLGTVHENTQG